MRLRLFTINFLSINARSMYK